jgi:hypothetical protein
LAAHQNNTTAAPPGALSSAAWGGTQTREQCSPLATERTHRSTCTPRPAPVATCRDKSLKNRGFQTPRADDQGGALRRLQSRAAGDEGGVGRATPLRRGSLTPDFVRTKVTARRANKNLVLAGTDVGLMIIPWSHAVCYYRRPLAAPGCEPQASQREACR